MNAHSFSHFSCGTSCGTFSPALWVGHFCPSALQDVAHLSQMLPLMPGAWAWITAFEARSVVHITPMRLATLMAPQPPMPFMNAHSFSHFSCGTSCATFSPAFALWVVHFCPRAAQDA